MSPTPSLAAALDRIRAFARAMDWKPARVAREAGLADIATRNMHKDDWSPTSSTIRRIEAVIPQDWKSGDPAPSRPDGPPPAEVIPPEALRSLAAAAGAVIAEGDQAVDEARADIAQQRQRRSA